MISLILVGNRKAAHRRTRLTVFTEPQRRNMQQAVMDGLVSRSKESRRIAIRELCETLHTLVILQLVAGRLERQVVTVVAEPKSHYRVVGEFRDDGGCRRRRALVNDQWTINRNSASFWIEYRRLNECRLIRISFMTLTVSGICGHQLIRRREPRGRAGGVRHNERAVGIRRWGRLRKCGNRGGEQCQSDHGP